MTAIDSITISDELDSYLGCFLAPGNRPPVLHTREMITRMDRATAHGERTLSPPRGLGHLTSLSSDRSGSTHSMFARSSSTLELGACWKLAVDVVGERVHRTGVYVSVEPDGPPVVSAYECYDALVPGAVLSVLWTLENVTLNGRRVAAIAALELFVDTWVAAPLLQHEGGTSTTDTDVLPSPWHRHLRAHQPPIRLPNGTKFTVDTVVVGDCVMGSTPGKAFEKVAGASTLLDHRLADF